MKPTKEDLYNAIIEAHSKAASTNTNNISTATFLNAYHGSGNVIQAIAAAMLTTGQVHAPLTETRNALRHFSIHRIPGPVFRSINGGYRYCGLGNSFHKLSIDPIFQDAYMMATDYVKDSGHHLLDEYTAHINYILNKTLYPNAAGITAYICHITDAPKNKEVDLFLKGRITGWLSLIS